jgi:hypothetical protein
MKFPVIIVHTTNDKETRTTVQDGFEYNGLLAEIVADPTTVCYQVYALVQTVTRTVKWEESM